MIATIPSATVFGVDGHRVAVEVHVSNGLPSFTIVGLPDASCREARDRVRAAVLSSGLPWCKRRITVNLAPSNLRKVGAGLDFAIAIGVLVADEVLPQAAVDDCAFVGELGLDGSVRRVHGMVSMASAIDASALVVPADNLAEAALVPRDHVRAVHTLGQAVAALKAEQPWPDVVASPAAPGAPPPDMAAVRGQPLARWAMEVAAAGEHNLLMCGPPGSGKTMLARRLPSLLPPLDLDSAMECTRIHSAAGTLPLGSGLLTTPTFRAPHHSSSMAALIGGGSTVMRPGEISLAHGGVLFLDEMAEFPPSVLDALRQPLEEGVVRVARATGTAVFPARFQLVGATNPCPCGEGMTAGRCTCSEVVKVRYSSRMSGPLRDRFDIRLNVLRPDLEDLFRCGAAEPSSAVAQRVLAARERAAARGVTSNSRLSAEEVERLSVLSPSAQRLLQSRMRRGVLTARGLHRVRRVALTIADLAGESTLSDHHIAAALELRASSLDAEGQAS